MNKTTIKGYKSISDRQLELMDDCQLVIAWTKLKKDLAKGKHDPEGLMLTDYNRVCVRMAERFERCYAFGYVPGVSETIVELKTKFEAELTACRNQIEILRVEKQCLLFELLGMEPELPSDSDSIGDNKRWE